MGDRYDREMMARRCRHLGMKIPEPILRWGIGTPSASIGHNGGPPFDDEPGYLLRRHHWARAHRAAWKNPHLDVLRFRVARAEAAGVTYRDYMLALLDTGRRPQATSKIPPMIDDKPMPAQCAERITRACHEAGTSLLPCVAPSGFDELARRLIAAYGDPGRHYHGLAHIAAMLDLLDAEAGAIGERETLILAILFHDAIYDARRADNEAQSAVYAECELSALGVDQPIIDRISALILATRHGAAPNDGTDHARSLLIDLDLSILAAAPEAYKAYAAAIRREYAHVSEADYRTGRSKVLDSFLARPKLYTTPWLQLRWEQRARRNLRAERATLTS